MIFLSIPGTLRMILIIIAVFVIVRFVGRIMLAKRNLDEERRYNQNNENFRKEKERSEREKGRTKVMNKGYTDAEDVDFEEVKD
jgi:uncharacterized protein YxeA